ncbi:DUF732 domain-containing protein [Mycolicibacterium mengxianglii]|uniref:DUF732 domain-containing protein n=1 Tax=Mycolicibacterium mengxianglii TaxID=2736649 RepID=UPI001E3BE47A|nr:DUF732 domain-containing protein [Mycolicibacterium mengxianglii]
MQPTIRTSRREFSPAAVVSAVLISTASAILLSGCTSGEDLMTSASPPPVRNAPAAGPDGVDGTLPSRPNSSGLDVTPEQRDYLESLNAAGVRRSSDLMALSIGSYVCQARAAGQSEQGVWDFVFPLVRGEIHDMNPNTAVTAIAAQVDDTTAQYIRIATDRLC